MTVNPFVTGDQAVGVRTTNVAGNDSVGYTVEVWYPAPDSYRHVAAVDTFKFVDELPEATQEAIRDAEPADGRRPLIMYWHGGYGHRREMAALCVFFASHGFVVAAPDFPGDHIRFMYGEDPEIKSRPIDASAEVRGRQAAEVVECLASGADDFTACIVDGENVGSFGMSLGGFTALAANTVSRRIKATFPMAPEPKRIAILKAAGHLHWGDNAELMHETLRHRYLSGDFPDPEIDALAIGRAFRPFSDLCPAQHAVDAMRSIGLAHFAANLSNSDDARALLADLAGTLSQRGIELELDGVKHFG